MSGRSSRPVWLGEDKRGWDHVRLHVQLLKDDRVGAYELAVYMGIAAHAELQTGEATPSLDTLATYAKCNERTVRRARDLLREWGYIEVKDRKGKASIYRLLPPPTLDSQSGVQEDTPDTQSGHPGHTVRTSADSHAGGPPSSESDELDRASEREPDESKTLAPSARQPDLLFEAVANVCGIDWRELTKQARGSMNAAVAQLRNVGATPESVRERAGNWPNLFDRATLTPPALAKHWPQLAQARAPSKPKDRYEEMAHDLNELSRRGEEDFGGQTTATLDQTRRSLPA